MKFLFSFSATKENIQKLQLLEQDYKEKLMDYQKRIAEMERKIEKQNNLNIWFCNIMAEMTWRCCKLESCVDIVVQSTNINDFLGLTNMALVSFSKTYPQQIPDRNTNDCSKLLTCLFGICCNIAAFANGKKCLATKKNGCIFLCNVLRSLDFFNKPNGRVLQRLSLMILCNTATDSNFLLSFPSELGNIAKCLSLSNTSDIHTLALTLLNILFEAASRQFSLQVMDIVVDSISEWELGILSKNPSPEVRAAAENLIANIKEFRPTFISH